MLDEDAQPEAAPLPGDAAAAMPKAASVQPWHAPLPATQAEPETTAIPPAPAWPPPEPEPEPEPAPAQEPEPEAEASPQPEPRPMGEPPAPPPPAVPPAPPGPSTSPGPAADLPITWPVTLSGWLVGAGSLAAAVTLLVRLGNPINLLIFVALLAIAASVFLADRVPTIAHQRLAILVVLTISLGVALERAAFRIQGVESVFLIAMIVAAGGALLLELGRDRPVPPLGGPG